MDNGIIHTYSPCNQLPLLFGLSDFIKGTSKVTELLEWPYETI
jgi:hypothetical protein